MAVFIKKVNIPQKSDLINIDMTGSGTAQTYRIIKKISDDVVEVIAMANVGTGAYSYTNTTYENNVIDVALNTTWYGNLSATAKSAIVDKTFRQTEWGTTGNPAYVGIRDNYGTIQKYNIALTNATYGNEITRHVYALSVQDIIDYLEVTPEMTQANTTLTYTNLWTIFWNSSTQQSQMIWLQDVFTGSNLYAYMVAGATGQVTATNYNIEIGYRPAFQIDLSKIDYTFTDGRQPVELKPVSILQKSNNALSRVGMSYKVPIIYPTKSDIVDIDMTGSGTPQRFRVIKANDNIVEVVALANASDSQQFASSGQVYANSSLDTYLNTTWYATLSNDAKTAIVDKAFRQESWNLDNSGNPDYNGYYGTTKPGSTSYVISLGNASFGTETTRHIYAIGTQDILDYILDTSITDAELQNYNIWKMLWDDEVQHTGSSNNIWLNSASGGFSSGAFCVYGHNGSFDEQRTNGTYGVRPAFQIDLSKIDFTIE